MMVVPFPDLVSLRSLVFSDSLRPTEDLSYTGLLVALEMKDDVEESIIA